MIDLFSEYTYEPTEDERKRILPWLIEKLSVATLAKPISARRLKGLAERELDGYVLHGARVRKLVHYIRIHDLLIGLVSNSKGYFIATDKEFVQAYIKSLYQRERSIAEVRSSLQHQQQRMP